MARQRVKYKSRAKVRQNVPVHPTSIWLPEDLRDDLQAEADDKRRSRSWLIVEILRQWQSFWTKQKQFKDR